MVAVVTGAAGGLGAAIAARLAADGARVAALDLEPGPSAGSVIPWACDVTDPEAVRSTVAEIVEGLGGLDMLVNNAGMLSGRSSLLQTTPEECHRYYAVNAVAPLLMVQACFPHLRDSPHRGRVVNVASRTFFTGAP